MGSAFHKAIRQLNRDISKLAKASESKADFGYGSVQRSVEAFERVEREAYPAQHHPRSAYSLIVGDVPILTPGDRHGAEMFLMQIERAIEQGGWTRAEWNRLYRMREKWKARAQGKCARFNLFGNRQGGLNKQEQRRLRQAEQMRGVRELIERGGD